MKADIQFNAARVSQPRVWQIDPRNDTRILETGPDPHTVCDCRRADDAKMILRLLPALRAQEEVQARAAELQTQRNALLNAIEIAGYRLAINNGVTLEIVPQDGRPDGENFVILKSLETK